MVAGSRGINRPHGANLSENAGRYGHGAEVTAPFLVSWRIGDSTVMPMPCPHFSPAHIMLRLCRLLAVVVPSLWLSALALAADPSPAEVDFFEKQVRPLLANRCYKCHGNIQDVKGGLKLTSREAVLKGGESGPAAVAGNPGGSSLIKAVKYDDLQMPPDAKLSDLEIASLA